VMIGSGVAAVYVTADVTDAARCGIITEERKNRWLAFAYLVNIL